MNLTLCSHVCFEYSVRGVVKVIGRRAMKLEDYLHMSLLLDRLLCLISEEYNVRIRLIMVRTYCANVFTAILLDGCI